MSAFDILYLLEHRLLPQWFFKEKGPFVLQLLRSETLLYEIADRLFEEEGEENPYAPDDFAVEPFSLSAAVKGLKLIFPKPEKEPLCYRCYLFFDMSFEKVCFFCVEKSADAAVNTMLVLAKTMLKEKEAAGSLTEEERSILSGLVNGEPNAGGAFLCGWDAGGTHLNFGRCSLEGQADFEKCKEIYIDQFGLGAE